MTTEDAIQAALDERPDDQVARCALADYLMENGDVRGEGYAVLALYGRVPRMHPDSVGFTAYEQVEFSAHSLPAPWILYSTLWTCDFWAGVVGNVRRMVEDKAALRWAGMSTAEKDTCLQKLAKVLA